MNDAPALKQAEVGIAVANATDVAKAAASLVLTNPGLIDILAAVKTSRRIYQRMLTYTLNKIIKTIEIAFLLSVGVMLTGSFVITPLLIVLLLFTNDFVTMSIATDTVSYSPQPDRWHIRSLVLVGLALGSLILVFSFGIFLAGRNWLKLPLPQLQTLVFITLVFTGQGNVYLVRQRQHFWDVKAQQVAGSELCRRYCARECSRFARHSDGGDPSAINFHRPDRLRLLSRGCRLFENRSSQKAAAGAMRIFFSALPNRRRARSWASFPIRRHRFTRTRNLLTPGNHLREAALGMCFPIGEAAPRQRMLYKLLKSAALFIASAARCSQSRCFFVTWI